MASSNFVGNLLQKASEEDEINFKSTNVEKNLELEYDIGNLAAFDANILDLDKYKKYQENYLKELARDNTQLLINRIWQLPSNRVEDAIVVKLPQGTTLIPREKQVPKAKQPTKWEQYAKEKGIQKRKKEKLVWDETVNDWRPRYGFKRVNSEKNDWVLEVPQNADPNTDMFAQKQEKKKERMAKNEFQRLRNLARAKNLKMPNQGLVPAPNPTKDHVNKAITIAKSSTASIGKFTEKLPDEKVAKNIGKKRKFESNLGNIETEKAKSLKILENLKNKAPKLDTTTAMNQLTHAQERQQAKENNGGGGGMGEQQGTKKKKAGKNGPKKTRGRKGSEKGGGAKRRQQQNFRKGGSAAKGGGGGNKRRKGAK